MMRGHGARFEAWRGALIGLVAALGGLSGCQSGGAARAMPPIVMPEVLPTDPPSGISAPDGAEGPVLVQHTDGLLYVLGLGGDLQVGDGVALSYGGVWSDKAGERPRVGFVNVTRVFPSQVALVQPLYLMPGGAFKGARAELWKKAVPPKIGKGVGLLREVREGKGVLSLGALDGVQPGDRFALLSPTVGGARLGQRLVGFASVQDVDKKSALVAVTHEGGPGGEAAEGQWALFTGPGLVERPKATLIQVGTPVGGDAAMRDEIVEALTAYIAEGGFEGLRAEGIDSAPDPRSPAFGRRSGQDFVEAPRLLLGAAVAQDKIVFNYASTGLSVAHSMIAATPEEGMIAGPASETSTLSPVFHNLVAAALTHRGENEAAIFLLETTLGQGGWDGPNRWHARDQLAMRWSQANQNWEALRTVQEDVARAESLKDTPAVINAVGTLMALFEEIDRMELSLDEAERFYTLRKSLGEGVYATHAHRAYIEVLYKAGKTEDAARELAALEEGCKPALDEARAAIGRGEEADPEKSSCISDIYYALMTFYWHSDRDDPTRRQLLDRATTLAEINGDASMGTIRLNQAMEALGADDLDGAMIGFLEAQRLFEAEHYTPGVARVEQLSFNLHLARGDRQMAFDAMMSAADKYARMNDITELIGSYRSVARLYMNVPGNDMMLAAYARSAYATMSEALRLQLAGDDFASAAEVFFVSGRFLLGSNSDQALPLLERACELALQTARFGLAAMARVSLAMLAQAQGDGAGFRANIDLAKEYARLSGDADLLQAIIQAEQGSFEPPPTTL